MLKAQAKVGCLLLLFLWLAAPSAARAQSEHVYLVKIYDCKRAPKCSRVQTGFRVRGMKGIVTALHGVADAGDIRVVADRGPTRFKGPLRIQKVDVAHDVALLTSDELQAAPADGLEAAQKVDWEAVGSLNLIGYPLRLMANLETLLPLRRPALKPLRDLLPPDVAVKLLERRSPDPDKNVVSVNGVILPGHSGAPALDVRGRLLAVGNGGLLGGLAGINWAIPWESVRLVNAATDRSFAALRNEDPGTLFVSDTERPELYRVRITVVDAGGVPLDGVRIVPSAGGEVLKAAAGGYLYELAGVKKPADGKLTLYASKENAFLKGRADLTLEGEANLTVTIAMSKDDSAAVRGVVIDYASRAAVEGARVSVEGYADEAVVTKAGGGFVLPAHAAVGEQVLLRVEKEGYEPHTQYEPGGNDRVTLTLVRRRP